MKYKNRKLLISFALIFSFLFQLSIPVVEASMASKLADFVNDVADAKMSTVNLQLVDGSSIQSAIDTHLDTFEANKFNSKVKELREANGDKWTLTEIETQARSYAASERAKEKAKFADVMPKVEETNKNVEKGKEEVEKVDKDEEGALTSKDLDVEQKLGHMSSLSESAKMMSANQASMQMAGEHLLALVPILKSVKDILDAVSLSLDVVSAILVAGGLSAPAAAATEALATGIDVAVAAITGAIAAATLLGNTYVSMAEQGKTDDAAFFKTLAKEVTELDPSLVWDLGSSLVDIVTVGKPGKWIKKTVENSKFLSKAKDFLDFDFAKEFGEFVGSKANSRCVNWVSDAFGCFDEKHTREFISTSTKIATKELAKATEEFSKDENGNATIEITDALKPGNTLFKYTREAGIGALQNAVKGDGSTTHTSSSGDTFGGSGGKW